MAAVAFQSFSPISTMDIVDEALVFDFELESDTSTQAFTSTFCHVYQNTMLNFVLNGYQAIFNDSKERLPNTRSLDFTGSLD